MVYLKLDPDTPDLHGQALWMIDIRTATPFENQAQASASKNNTHDASGVVYDGQSDHWYVIKGSAAPID
jgi:hypothetical protein